MKRLSITFDDDIYVPIEKMARQQNTTIKKIVMAILRNEIYKPNELSKIDTMDKDIKECLFLLNKLSKKQSLHYNLSTQHFVNHGYLSNANPNESKSYQELLEKHKNKFND